MTDQATTGGEAENSSSPGSPGAGEAGSPVNSERLFSSEQISLRAWLLLLIILAVGAGLRIARIHYASLIFDEQWHLELSTGRGSTHVSLTPDEYIPDAPAATSLAGAPPWYYVWTHMNLVVHPPLYCTILRLWRDVFGEGDVAARSLSILCSLVAVALLFFVAREAHGLAPAAWAAAIFAVVPVQVSFAQQVRGYDMLGAEAMAALWALIRLEKYSKQGRVSSRWTIVLGVSVLAMLLTHYFAIGASAAMGCYVLLRLRGRIRRDAVVSLFAAGFVFFIVWGPFLWKQRHGVADSADPWLMEPDPRHLTWTLMRLGSWPLRVMFEMDRGNRINLTMPFTNAVMKDASISYWPIVPGMLLLVLPLWMVRRRPGLVLWLIWLAGTLGFVAMLDLVRGTSHLRFVRYIWLATPAILMIGMLLIDRLPVALKHGIPAVVVILGFCLQWTAYTSEEPNWRALGQWVDESTQHDETLIFAAGLNPDWFRAVGYLGSAHYSHGFPRGIVKRTSNPSGTLMSQIPGSTAWLISGPFQHNPSRVTQEDVDRLLPGAKIIGSPEIFPDLAICTHLQLPRAAATTPAALAR